MADYILQVTSGQSYGMSAPLSGGYVTIGRDPASELCVDDPYASRFHARLADNGQQVILTDLNSTNGTMVNGRRIANAVIRPGDVISVGSSQILFAARQAPQRAAGFGYSQHPPSAPPAQRPMQPPAQRPMQPPAQRPMQPAAQRPMQSYPQSQSPSAPAARRPRQSSAASRTRRDNYPPPRPASASSTNWGGLLAAILIIGVIGGAIYWFFSMSSQTDEEIAAEVAARWTTESVEEVAGQAMRVATGTSLGSGLVADQIKQRVSWSYSAPDCPRSGRCDVTATARASSPFSVRIPVLLNIDTGAKRVDRWAIQFDQASLAGIEGGDVIGSAANIASGAADTIGSIISDDSLSDIDDVVGGASDAWNALDNISDGSLTDFDYDSDDVKDVAESIGSIGGMFR